MSSLAGRTAYSVASDLTGPTTLYAPGDAGAVALVADIRAVADSQLVGLYLHHDSATYRSMGTGVSTLIDQSGAIIDLTQGTGSRQPTIDSALGPYNRGRTIHVAASDQTLEGGVLHVAAVGERWGVIQVLKWTNTTAVAQDSVTLRDDAGNVSLQISKTAGNITRGQHNYDDGGAGAYDSITAESPITTNLQVIERYGANPGTLYRNGVITTSAVTAGAGPAGDPSLAVVVGGYIASADVSIGLTLVVKQSGIAPPLWRGDVFRMVRNYFSGGI